LQIRNSQTYLLGLFRKSDALGHHIAKFAAADWRIVVQQRA